jgi:uncharacterized protein YbaR (Trm112 family)/ubiquinone/menaquinone biosynthesis C-methylase UbiE
MHIGLLDILRCPFCGTRLSAIDNAALVRDGDVVQTGVLGCECCAYPVVEGIPVLIADEGTRDAMHALEAGRAEEALFALLGLDANRAVAFRRVMTRGGGATFRELIDVLSPELEGTYFVYRFSDATFVMAEAVCQALAQDGRVLSGRVLDLCGGSGHLTRVWSQLEPAGGTVLADLYFWKLWLAKRFMAPEAHAICCDANNPLPFVRESFSAVALCDAFPYIWQRRMVADEMMRVATLDGVVALPHVHSALGENYSAGMPLTPVAYRELFAAMEPRLYSDATLLEQAIEAGAVDLTYSVTPAELGTEASLTIVASRRPEVFCRRELAAPASILGELRVNPLYRIDRRGPESLLTLTFPTPEYEDEFSAVKRYLPATLALPGDLTGILAPEALGGRYEELRRRRVLLDLPRRYL